jgi:hypothetical protein
MKKIGLQIGVGLMIGIGALLMTAPSVQAGPPCPKETCVQGEDTCGYCQGPTHYFNGQPMAFYRLSGGAQTIKRYCINCDDERDPNKNNSCTFNYVDYYFDSYTCEIVAVAPGGGVHDPQYDQPCHVRWIKTVTNLRCD